MNRASIVLLFSILFAPPLHARILPPDQEGERYVVVIPVCDTLLQLPRRFVVQGSERIVLDSAVVLLRGRDYVLDPNAGTVLLTARAIRTALGDSLALRSHVLLTIEYAAPPLDFRSSYTLHSLTVRRDTSAQRTLRVAQPSTRSLTSDLFGTGLDKSGSVVRGFTVGSNRDMTLTSGLRLQLSGKLSDDVDVVAALTDENTPIQPEGTTQTLREVDKVFVEIRNPRYGATLGDFDLMTGPRVGGEFGMVKRKLQGAQGTVRSGPGGELSGGAVVTAASTRGKFNSNALAGADGVQGPYRLSGKNAEPQIVIVAGSERVYLNGEPMTRGETNDYVIDYASGEVTFSSRRLITNASRIVVDFEYSDQAYTRNLVGASVTSSMFSGRATINALFLQEADDPDSPLQVTLSDDDRQILRNSGGDRLKASRPGIHLAPRDSVSGRLLGSYLLRDTLVNARIISILVYAPGDSLAIYDAIFSSVASVPSDSAGYIRVGVGQFRFAGLGSGNYMPLQLLPLPERHQIFDLNGEGELADGLRLKGEYAASRFDANRFAPNAARADAAYGFGLTYAPRSLIIGGASLGAIVLSLRDRHVGGAFSPLDRPDSVEFNRQWNLEQPRTVDEDLREGSVRWNPDARLTGAVEYGSMERRGQLTSNRWQVDAAAQDSSLPSVAYRLERISSDDRGLSLRSDWTRQRGTAEYPLGFVRTGLRIETEDRSRQPEASDSLLEGGFRFFEVAPRVSITRIGAATFSGEWQWRTEDSVAAGVRSRASAALTQLYTGQYQPSPLYQTQLTLSLRRVEFTDEYRRRGNTNGDVILLRSQSRLAPFDRALETDLYYEFSNQRSSRLERVFVKVPLGTGNYRYMGDRNGNGIQDETDFDETRFDGDYIVAYIPSEQLVPVADLRASVRVRFQPGRIAGTGGGMWNAILRSFSTETFLRLDERSKDPDEKQIYLLNVSHMLSPANTISGAQQVTQDLFFFENERSGSLRFRFNERDGLVQLVSAVERSVSIERSVRARIQLVPEIGNQTEVTDKTDRVTATVATPRVRGIASLNVTSDFSYRPDRQWEAGFVLGGGTAENRAASGMTHAAMNDQTLRIIYAMPTAGQLRIEFKREEVLLSGQTAVVPFELTGGKVQGQNWLWQGWFDYRITSNLQLTLSYSGRTDGGRSPVHTMHAEARAFF